MVEVSIKKRLGPGKGNFNLDVKFNVPEGAFITLYGPSGAGKTSLLRVLAGLLKPEEGFLKVKDEWWFDQRRNMYKEARLRQVGLVFQDYALFPNMTVRENLKFALLKNQKREIIDDLMDMMELGSISNRKPHTLSGGQKQRVALARALVQKPRLLLMDEPLAALDPEIRTKLQQYILDLHHQFGLTTLLVSHDVSEIIKLSDKILEIRDGKIVAENHPVDHFTQKGLSGKFQFTGEVISCQKQDFIFIVTVLIGNNLIKVIADQNQGTNIHPGDKVLVASKAFNPIIQKIS